MPSGKTHDAITFLIVAPTFVATWKLTENPPLAAIVTLAMLVGGLMFGPDLDTHSKQYTRWGFFSFLWYPYKVFFGHRSRWSHGLLFGTLLRAAKTAPKNAKGRANKVCLTFIIRSVVFNFCQKLCIWIIALQRRKAIVMPNGNLNKINEFRLVWLASCQISGFKVAKCGIRFLCTCTLILDSTPYRYFHHVLKNAFR